MIDVTVDGAQRGAEFGWGLGLIAGNEGSQDAVVDFAVEDREAESVVGEGVEVVAGGVVNLSGLPAMWAGLGCIRPGVGARFRRPGTGR
jgi:hypothetical protein